MTGMVKIAAVLFAFLIALSPAFCLGDPSQADGAAKSAVLTFSSFDGGGPEYCIETEDPTVVTFTCRREYDDPDHEMMTGSGYREICTFTGLRPGTTGMTVYVSSPLSENYEMYYTVVVDEDLSVKLLSERKLGRFGLYHSAGGASASYAIVAFMDGYALSVDGGPFRNIESGTVEALLGVIEQYDLYKWDGSIVSQGGDAQSESFRLEVSFTDETYIYAVGDGSSPEELRQAMDEMLAILRGCLPE